MLMKPAKHKCFLPHNDPGGKNTLYQQHPKGIGGKNTAPYFFTDFSESG
jgi:hypothetical protein